MSSKEERVDIKSINPSALTTIAACDDALQAVNMAIETMTGQQDFELVGGSIDIGDLPADRKVWLLKSKSAMRYAKATRKGLYNRREQLWRAHEAIRARLVSLIGEGHVQKIEEEARA